jgi:putative acetyltransferase
MIIEKYNFNSNQKITQLFKEVFSKSEGVKEGEIIANLVDNMQKTTNPKDIFGFIAKDKEVIIGCVFFTRLEFENKTNGFILSPMAVATKYQKQGIGQKLINFGINFLKKNGVELLITYGDPSFYSKVGFKNISPDIIKPPFKLSYPQGWLIQDLQNLQNLQNSNTKKQIQISRIHCVSALNNPEYW